VQKKILKKTFVLNYWKLLSHALKNMNLIKNIFVAIEQIQARK